MLAQVKLFPEQASTVAGDIDALFLFIIGITTAISVVTAVVLIYFAIRYRRKAVDEVPPLIHGSLVLEIAWSAIPLVIVMVMFFWSIKVYFGYAVAPENSIEIYVTGRQWMWKVQHPDGQREILGYYDFKDTLAATPGSEMHIPVGQPVKLLLTSEDVIHSFAVPDFRVKQDALPGRYTTMWFQATKPGRYRMFCAEYCGMNHSKMGGWIVAQDPVEYQQWLSSKADRSLALKGRQLFLKFQCISCHSADADAQAPRLENAYLKKRLLADGKEVLVDESYYIESIRNPRAKVANGFAPIMPPYLSDQMSPDELLELLAFLKAAKTGDIPKRNEMMAAPAVVEGAKP